MGKKILVAIDDSENALRAVNFISESFTHEHQITLFSVIIETDAICEMNSPSLTPVFLSQRDTLCALENLKKDLVETALKKGKSILIDAGFRETDVSIKTVTGKKGVARSIIKEAESGYDAVVLGRRGLKGVKDFFLGSVSLKVLQSAKDISVLIID